MNLTETQRRRRGDDGFTMVELAFVFILMAISIAIQLPTWADAIARNQDTVAQASVAQAIQAARTEFLFDPPDTAEAVARLTAAEPTYTYLNYDAESSSPREMSVLSIPSITGASDVIMATRSASGDCLVIRDNGFEGATYARWETSGTDPCHAEHSVVRNQWLAGGLRGGTAITTPTPINWTP